MKAIALAGRRIDPPNIENLKFPLENIERVENQLFAFFCHEKPTHLVCSAACGADLLALRAAERAGVRHRIIVLPFIPDEFRNTSVIDRPGKWQEIYDREVSESSSRGELVSLCLSPKNQKAYEIASNRIIFEAQKYPVVEGLLVWDGEVNGPQDQTNYLALEMRKRGWGVREIYTN